MGQTQYDVDDVAAEKAQLQDEQINRSGWIATAAALSTLFISAMVVTMLVFTTLANWSYTQAKGDEPIWPYDIRAPFFICFAWLPIGLSVLAAVCLDVKGSYWTIEALDESPPPGKHNFWQRVWGKLWQVKHLFGPKWWPATWSLGDYLVIFLLLTANLIWVLQPLLESQLAAPRMSHGKMRPETDLHGWLDQICEALGLSGTWNAAAAVVFTIRENHLTKAAMSKEGGQYHRGLRYHVGLGYTAFLQFLAHGLFFLIDDWERYGQWNAINPTVWNGHGGGMYQFWGLLSLVSLLGMVATSISIVRRKAYRIFYWCHQLYIPFIVFGCLHDRQTVYPMVGVLLYFVYDRFAPRLRIRRGSQATVEAVSPTVSRVTIKICNSVAQEYAPGDWINLKVPEISYFNWHPFSIGSYYRTSPDAITIFVSTRGKWTQKLHDIGKRTMGEEPVKVSVDGPFGVRSRSYLDCDRLVLFGAGTGITAVMPYLCQWSRCKPTGQSRVIWASRYQGDAVAYSDYHREFNRLKKLGTIDLRIHLTRQGKGPATAIDVEGDPNDARECTETPHTERLNDNAQVHSNSAEGISASSDEYAAESVTIASESELSDPILVKPERKTRRTMYALNILLVIALFGVGMVAWASIKSVTYKRYLRAKDGGYGSMCQDDFAPSQLPFGWHMWCYWWAPAGHLAVAIAAAMILGFAISFIGDRINKARGPIVKHESRLETIRDIPELQWIEGRPDLKASAEEILQESSKESTTAVFIAGPDRMARVVEKVLVGHPHVHVHRESWKM